MDSPSHGDILRHAGVLPVDGYYYVRFYRSSSDHAFCKMLISALDLEEYAFTGEQVFSHDQAEKIRKSCADLGHDLLIVDLASID